MGFVGSALAESFKAQSSEHQVCVFDNLRRRGSESNLARLKKLGVRFVHGDVRIRSDLFDIGQNFDLLIEASAEPSVLSGTDGNTDYLLSTNLFGLVNCLEYAKRHAPNLIFLSTSRVYGLEALKKLPLIEEATRLSLGQEVAGAGIGGIREEFEVMRARSLYGATKLAGEVLIHDYADSCGLKAVINRCGVIAGPGQWGKTDQGVFTLWVVHHAFSKKLGYTGFGGQGKQVRDLLHPLDLFEALEVQSRQMDRLNGETFNLGGGITGSVSLQEMTKLCQEVTGNKIEIASRAETAAVDVPWYVSDCRKAAAGFGFSPQRSPSRIVGDIHAWLLKNEKQLRTFFS